MGVLARSLARSDELMPNSRKRAAPACDAPAAKRTKQAVVMKAKTLADIVYRPSFAPQNITDREAIFRAGIDKVDQARKQRVEHWLAVRKTRINVRNCFAPVCEAKKLVAISKARRRALQEAGTLVTHTLSLRLITHHTHHTSLHLHHTSHITPKHIHVSLVICHHHHIVALHTKFPSFRFSFKLQV